MPIKYLDLGSDKKLNEIVMLGSHDAGITGGGANAKTQAFDLYDQARAGVRFFDMRIAAKASGADAELKTFHAPGMLKKVLTPTSTSVKTVYDTGAQQQVKTTRLNAGTWGMGLTELLLDAYKFVTFTQYKSEFLILKFDKSSNWLAIAEACHQCLGAKLYTGGGNLNTKTLDDLKGSVIVLFPSQDVPPLGNFAGGIHFWKNLYKDKAAYDANYQGLQYWGEGGTSIFKPGYKIEQNIDKQSGILKKAAVGAAVPRTLMQKIRRVPKTVVTADPNALGMMYWTTTGVVESIKKRDDSMWNGKNRFGLDKVWLQAVNQYYDAALPRNVDQQSFGSAGMLKLFMPNIVMVDFADETKGKYVYDLNGLASTKLVQATTDLYKMHEASFQG